MVAATEAECEVVAFYLIFDPPTLPTPLRLHFLVPRHLLFAVATRPVGLLAEDSWIGLHPLLADVLPLRIVVQAHAVSTLGVGMFLTSRIAMGHSNPPFWPPVF